ncbi:helix-turn-helix domain-containing protein [Pseudomonas oryzihabitans]|uniref:DNA-binding protein n=1 Tax=Pseudomonas oryzihabitans TaxID=47885 RepID=A0A2Z5ABS7_9PSED|nr:helix-turn-helix transcriptional regulator [Pseudomonas oryzihabitans]AXA66730.1 DNA-binding protein [Pseudomonas oryzihabitans]
MTIPHEVVGYMIIGGMTPTGAWRRHLALSQAEVAARMGSTEADYAQQEQDRNLRRSAREKIAAALGIAPDLLDI